MEQLVTAASRELRLGELLWAGSTGLWQARPCPFFPRQWFGALALPRAAGWVLFDLDGGIAERTSQK